MALAEVASAAKPRVTMTPDNRFSSKVEEWDLPHNSMFLATFVIELFTRYWRDIVFSSGVSGATLEMMAPSAPTRITNEQGLLTLFFGEPHIHLRIAPGFPGDRTHAEGVPSRAFLYRRYDKKGAPRSWGFAMQNALDQRMFSIFFPNPFSAGEVPFSAVRWERLAVWRDVSARYLGLPPDPIDETGEVRPQ